MEFKRLIPFFELIKQKYHAGNHGKELSNLIVIIFIEYDGTFNKSVGTHFIWKHIPVTREGFLRKNIVAVSFFQNRAIHQYF